MEACPFVEWFIDRYPPCVDRMDIADATELSLRRGKRRKNDPNDLRWALCQAAVTLCQSDAKQEATRQRFIARMPRTKAKRRAHALQ